LLELAFDCWTEKDKVRRYMSTKLCQVKEEDDWVDVADLFRSRLIRRVPVSRDGKLVGIISGHDLLHTIQDARRLVRQVLAQQQAQAN